MKINLNNPIKEKRRWRRRALAVGVVSSLACSAAFAEFSYDYAGFGTLGLSVADSDVYQLSDTTVGYERDTRFALQGSLYYNEDFSLTGQVISRASDDFQPDIDWLYLGYRASDRWNFRAGILKRPVYAISDYLEVGYAYPWVLPPEDVYSTYIRSLDAFTGLSVLYEQPFDSWNAGFETYYGYAKDELDFAGFEGVDYELPHNFGVVFFASNASVDLRLNYHASPQSNFKPLPVAQAAIDELGPLVTAGFSDVQATLDALDTSSFYASYANASVNVDHNNWLFGAEYSFIANPESVVPGENTWYIMTGRRMGAFTGFATVSRRTSFNEDDISDPLYEAADDLAAASTNPGLPTAQQQALAAQSAAVNQAAVELDETLDQIDTQQYSISAGLRYDFNAPIAAKVEVQRIVDEKTDDSIHVFSVALDFTF